MVVVLVLAAASGLWMWVALRDPKSPLEWRRPEPSINYRPVPPPVRDLVSVQASWRAEHEFTSPAPALRQFVPPSDPPGSADSTTLAAPTVLTWSQPPMRRAPLRLDHAAPQAGQVVEEPVE